MAKMTRLDSFRVVLDMIELAFRTVASAVLTVMGIASFVGLMPTTQPWWLLIAVAFGLHGDPISRAERVEAKYKTTRTEPKVEDTTHG